VGKQLTIRGSFVIPIWMLPEMAAFIAGHKLPLEKMVTHRFGIDQAKEAFELFDSGECGKVVFEF
jgi:propanol-preferring alcohol dehydrogenase